MLWGLLGPPPLGLTVPLLSFFPLSLDSLHLNVISAPFGFFLFTLDFYSILQFCTSPPSHLLPHWNFFCHCVSLSLSHPLSLYEGPPPGAEGAEPDNEARTGLGPLASHGGQQHICMTVIYLWRWVKSLTGKCNDMLTHHSHLHTSIWI